jgi:hypothetical protein
VDHQAPLELAQGPSVRRHQLNSQKLVPLTQPGEAAKEINENDKSDANRLREAEGFAIFISPSPSDLIFLKATMRTEGISLHEPSELPLGFGLRQPSGALDRHSVTKAVEGHRSPRRCRARASSLQFMVPRHDPEIVEAPHV